MVHATRIFGIISLTILLFSISPQAEVFAQSRGRGSASADSSRASRPVSPESRERAARPSGRTSSSEETRATGNDNPAARSSAPSNTGRGDRPAARERATQPERGARQADRPSRSDEPERGTVGGPVVSPRDAERTPSRPEQRESEIERRDREYNRPQEPDYRRPQGGQQGSWGRPSVPPPVYRPRPNAIRIDVQWPWEYRYRRGWTPQYQYRQVVYVDVGWGRSRRETRLDIRTHYRHRLRRATRDRAEVDIYLESVEIFENGRFLGQVTRFPSDLERIRATVYRNGHVEMDRNLFLLGDPYEGFELISTRWYDRYVLDAYQRSHGFRVGALDFRRQRVVSVRRSRLFDPYDFNGYAPVALLPEDRGALLDYGYSSPSIYYHDRVGYHYYGGGFDYDYYLDEDDRYAVYSQPGVPREVTTSRTTRGDYSRDEPRDTGAARAIEPLRRRENDSVQTERGAAIRIQRETELRRTE